MRVPPYARNPIRFSDDGQTAFIGLTRGQEAVIDVGDVARLRFIAGIPVQIGKRAAIRL